MSVQDYIKPEAVQNFRHAWEELDASTEMTDDYGLGQRDSLQVLALLVTCLLSCTTAFG